MSNIIVKGFHLTRLISLDLMKFSTPISTPMKNGFSDTIFFFWFRNKRKSSFASSLKASLRVTFSKLTLL